MTLQSMPGDGQRLTPQDLESVVVSEHYFTALEGVRGAFEDTPDAATMPLSLTTFCVLVLVNGARVEGVSHVVDPALNNPKIGREVARRNAINKLWELEGYRLKQWRFEHGMPK